MRPLHQMPDLSHAKDEVKEVLTKLSRGMEPSKSDARILAYAEGADIDAMAETADQMRAETVGDRVTFTLNRNINFTNVCFVGCSFCGFSRSRTSKDAYFLTLDQMIAKTAEAVELGATEVCIQGGLEETMPATHYIDMVKAIKDAFPAIHIHAFSPMEIDYGVEKTGMSLNAYFQALKKAGLGSIPGTAAEILDDRIRQKLSPVKLTADRWEEIIRTAHQNGIRSTSTMMYGHVETPDDWVNHLFRLREIQKDTGGFTEFVPLGFIHYDTHAYKFGRARAGATYDEHKKVHALSRILLHGLIDNIQLSWVKLGPERGSELLHAGANDFGGTLMEENISKQAGSKFGEYLSAEEIAAYIQKAGKTPAIRDTLYTAISPYEPASSGSVTI
nr:5-amino-6-(D-ribitylamino)uracil--L-tyrosine 4-hydroxyphenyl transferase CofH [Salisediminibacterium selenitireducens]